MFKYMTVTLFFRIFYLLFSPRKRKALEVAEKLLGDKRVVEAVDALLVTGMTTVPYEIFLRLCFVLPRDYPKLNYTFKTHRRGRLYTITIV